jgi:predicted acylesterase/phospholipase RssA
MLKGERLMEFPRRNFVDRPIEKLDVPFAAVATALHTGAEVWLRDDSTADAVRSSLALPGSFPRAHPTNPGKVHAALLPVTRRNTGHRRIESL